MMGSMCAIKHTMNFRFIVTQTNKSRKKNQEQPKESLTKVNVKYDDLGYRINCWPCGHNFLYWELRCFIRGETKNEKKIIIIFVNCPVWGREARDPYIHAKRETTNLLATIKTRYTVSIESATNANSLFMILINNNVFFT